MKKIKIDNISKSIANPKQAEGRMNRWLENNKLIAEFMGYRVFYKRYPRNHGIGAPELQLKDCIVEKTKYHSSWDWLMPVVEKINKLEDGIYKIIISAYWSGTKLGDYKLFNDKYDTPIIQTYKAVVEFIEQYNEQNK